MTITFLKLRDGDYGVVFKAEDGDWYAEQLTKEAIEKARKAYFDEGSRPTHREVLNEAVSAGLARVVATCNTRREALEALRPTITLKGPAPSPSLVRQMVRVQKAIGTIPKKARFVKLD